jgi:hypothetical protein
MVLFLDVGEWVLDSIEGHPHFSGKKAVKRQPDFVLVLVGAFALAVLLTLLLPLAANNSVADPASALQAGVIIRE